MSTERKHIDKRYKWKDIKELITDVETAGIEKYCIMDLGFVGGGGNTQIYAPNFKSNKEGRISFRVPREFFDNQENIKQLNKGQYRLLCLALKYKKE